MCPFFLFNCTFWKPVNAKKIYTFSIIFFILFSIFNTSFQSYTNARQLSKSNKGRSCQQQYFLEQRTPTHTHPELTRAYTKSKCESDSTLFFDSNKLNDSGSGGPNIQLALFSWIRAGLPRGCGPWTNCVKLGFYCVATAHFIALIIITIMSHNDTPSKEIEWK